MKEARIEDLEVDMKQPLSSTAKTNLIKIIDDEFQRQTTVFNEQIRDSKEKVMVGYRKKVGFEKIRASLRKKQGEIADLKAKLSEYGLSENGGLLVAYGNVSIKQKENIRRVEKMISDITMQSPNTLKNKIISRMWLANTNGEAVVILREVLGNGVIPSISKEKLALTYKNNNQ